MKAVCVAVALAAMLCPRAGLAQQAAATSTAQVAHSARVKPAAPAPASAAAAKMPEPAPAVITLPKPLEDSLSTELSEILASFIRKSEPGWPLQDHPEEYARCVAVLARLFTVAGDTLLDDAGAQNYFIDRSLSNLRYPTSPRGQFPRTVSFSNPRRAEEWVTYLAIRKQSGGIGFQRLGEDAPCCWRASAIQTWEEDGRDRLIATLMRQDSTGAHQRIQFFTREGDRYNLTRTVGSEAYGGRYIPTLLNKVEKTPLLNIIYLQTSNLFANFPAEQIVKLRGFYRVRGDSIELIRDQFGDSYFGAPTWAMECMARGRTDWGKLWTENEDVLHRLAALPWDKARSGWIMEKFSTRHDTLTCSHPSIGRITLYSVRSNGLDRVKDFKLEPLEADTAATTPKLPASGKDHGR